MCTHSWDMDGDFWTTQIGTDPVVCVSVPPEHCPNCGHVHNIKKDDHLLLRWEPVKPISNLSIRASIIIYVLLVTILVLVLKMS